MLSNSQGSPVEPGRARGTCFCTARHDFTLHPIVCMCSPFTIIPFHLLRLTSQQPRALWRILVAHTIPIREPVVRSPRGRINPRLFTLRRQTVQSGHFVLAQPDSLLVVGDTGRRDGFRKDDGTARNGP